MSKKPNLNPTSAPAPVSKPVASAASPIANKAAAVAEVKPSHDAIRARAYELYLARRAKGQPGSPESDWNQAERDLSKR